MAEHWIKPTRCATTRCATISDQSTIPVKAETSQFRNHCITYEIGFGESLLIESDILKIIGLFPEIWD